MLPDKTVSKKLISQNLKRCCEISFFNISTLFSKYLLQNELTYPLYLKYAAINSIAFSIAASFGFSLA